MAKYSLTFKKFLLASCKALAFISFCYCLMKKYLSSAAFS